jgi:hypothetical protein
MKNLTLILIVLLLIAGVVIYLQWKSATLAQRDSNLEAREFRAKQKENLRQINESKDQVSLVLKERDSIKAAATSEQRNYKTTISSLRKRVTGPAVVQDTIIIYQDSLIASIEQERDTVYQRDNTAIDSLQRSVDTLQGMFSEQLKESISLQNELNREEGKNVTVGPGVSVDYRGRPIITISAHYKLFSFRIGKKRR